MILGGKHVNANGIKMGFTLRGAWTWTAEAVQRYTESERDLCKAYAEDE